MPSENVMPKQFDYTMMSTYLACPKKYYLRIVRGIVGKAPPVAAEFGRVIHKALDSWYTDYDNEKALKVFTDNWKDVEGDEKRTVAVGKKLLSLYFEKYENPPFKVLASELPFTVALTGAEVELIGRIDKIIEWNGEILIMDHKTTSRLGYEFFYKIKPNMQFDGYIYAARNMGYPKCDGIMLDALLVAKGLCVPAQLAKLTPLARDISNRTESDMKQYLSDVNEILAEIDQCYESGKWRRNTESCCDFVECPYRKICKEDADLHERIIDSEYKIEYWDPHKAQEVT